MDFHSVVHKLENGSFEDRSFDTSGNTSECSNRTPSIESWENNSGKIFLPKIFFDTSKNSENFWVGPKVPKKKSQKSFPSFFFNF